MSSRTALDTVIFRTLQCIKTVDLNNTNNEINLICLLQAEYVCDYMHTYMHYIAGITQFLIGHLLKKPQTLTNVPKRKQVSHSYRSTFIQREKDCLGSQEPETH